MSGWTAVIPVKPWRLGKSRLHSSRRITLARAFALDTLEATAATPSVGRVVVVSSEAGLILPARSLGAAIVADHPLKGAGGLAAAVDLGRRWAVSRFPGEPIVVVPADLPCLTPEVLDGVLAEAAEPATSFVPDAQGDGTTLLAARIPRVLPIAYGPGSADLHRAAGAHPLFDVDPRARRDVDTVLDLQAAAQLGTGRHTRRATAPRLRATG
ncbi:2-phospho-L-lactate guanylyltransferase [Aeromicrobium sp. Leaf350]|uniref:2-phospho-L-lactate guanylyltransferase n=1 Tax=Aeromicrobium sp. Leaf350 TaxID=2876565 RepID=UPI001E298F1E|nr:2-phospho-L-lactate guanylyltransferase [Aeromicrobium sp. Leaf350]